MRHLVFEGLDRSGKSTLLAAVAKAIGATVNKMRVPKTLGQSIEFYDDHFRHLAEDEHPVVWDRGHLSELVYAPLYRPSETNSWWVRELRRRAAAIERVGLVYVYPGWYGLMLEDERPGANRMAEAAGYARELEHVTWPTVRVCTHRQDAEGVWHWRPVEEMVDEVLDGLMPQYRTKEVP